MEPDYRALFLECQKKSYSLFISSALLIHGLDINDKDIVNLSATSVASSALALSKFFQDNDAYIKRAELAEQANEFLNKEA